MLRYASILLCLSILAAVRAAEPPIDFGRQIQPILSDRCYKCHGPDEAKRQAELRLDRRESALADREGKHAIVPGNAAASELIRRITSHDGDERMPPADSKLTLDAAEIALLRRWIDEGARWGEHWAFVAPRRTPLPSIVNPAYRAWPRNAIDSFILARLEAEKLAPSPEAERTTLLRRVTLDLTGLPPTPAETAAFLADNLPDAYERLVDRLLASPRYGERMALPWLDAARYADTSGYQSDGPREMWRWRDELIESLNANQPFDRFTLEQLAGDLLPAATPEQRTRQQIASGFHRNHRGNAEGGIIAAEYEVEYVVDRVDTTATVWLGLTLGCTRCHDHKYDPFTQEEFYKLYAYFNSIPEHGRALKEGNSPPYVTAPTRRQTAELAAAERRLAAAEAAFRANEPALARNQQDWERTAEVGDEECSIWAADDDDLRHPYELDELPIPPADFAPNTRFADAFVGQGGQLTLSDGRIGKAIRFGGDAWIEVRHIGKFTRFRGNHWVKVHEIENFGYFDRFTLAAWIHPDSQSDGTILSQMTDVPEGDGYSIVLRDGRIAVRLVKRWLDDAIRVETAERVVAAKRWQHVAVAYDGTRRASGIRVYVDGLPVPLKIELDAINQTFTAKDQPLRIGAGGGQQMRFRGAIDQVEVFAWALTADEVQLVATPDAIKDILATPREKRSARQEKKLRAHFLCETVVNEWEELRQARKTRAKLVESLPNVMVMEELTESRPAHVLLRGQYDRPGKQVSRGTPAALPPLPKDAPNNRLGLARWIVDPANPLTARVAVNRQWQLFFGTGLVRTGEDFGTQGERPTHPELLDWLAREFVESGWDVKRLQRQIVTSATYRQSSRVSPQLIQHDPDNRLLARGPRFRLPPHAVRDQALAAAGLLVEQVGGPSVKPLQPPGLWEELAGAGQKYVPGQGADLYRRSLYTYWKRTAPPPSLMTFDASDRETCTVRRPRTNTPLQALALLNETTYVEAARLLAARALHDSPGGDAPLAAMFQIAAGRPPTAEELAILKRSRDYHRDRFTKRRDEALELLAVGDAWSNGPVDIPNFAAHTVVASLILNLDEVVTRE